MVQCTKTLKIFSEGCAVRIPRSRSFGDCKANSTSIFGSFYDNETLAMTFKSVKSETSKCFRLKSSMTRIWNDPNATYNYYPVCYEYNCIEDPNSNLGWKIDVTIASNTFTCTEQG